MMCDANERNHDAVISPTFNDAFWQSAVFGGNRNHEIKLIIREIKNELPTHNSPGFLKGCARITTRYLFRRS